MNIQSMVWRKKKVGIIFRGLTKNFNIAKMPWKNLLSLAKGQLINSTSTASSSPESSESNFSFSCSSPRDLEWSLWTRARIEVSKTCQLRCILGVEIVLLSSSPALEHSSPNSSEISDSSSTSLEPSSCGNGICSAFSMVNMTDEVLVPKNTSRLNSQSGGGGLFHLPHSGTITIPRHQGSQSRSKQIEPPRCRTLTSQHKF